MCLESKGILFKKKEESKGMKFTLVIISHNVFGLEFSEDLSSILVICLKGGVTAFSGRILVSCLLLGELNSVAVSLRKKIAVKHCYALFTSIYCFLMI
jgi:hypothetical protein